MLQNVHAASQKFHCSTRADKGLFLFLMFLRTRLGPSGPYLFWKQALRPVPVSFLDVSQKQCLLQFGAGYCLL